MNREWQSKVGRDILFIERNLDFLKPGGRMAIVLPQGRFNNSSDKNIRDFIAERCRILAVVGLHGNTFKPHTGTKTSVLFVQKWNDDPKAGALCPRQDDYNIFFATMRKSGKDNSGEKMWRKISSSTSPPDDELSELMLPSPMQRVVGVEGDFLQDVHGHLVVDHDLYNHEKLTEDGIAEAFIEFAKKEKLSFFESSPSVTPFDAVRYQQLMDGLEAVELSLSNVLDENVLFRFDAEYFKKKYIELDKLLRSREAIYLSYCSKSIINFGAYSLCNQIEYLKEGVPYLNVADIGDNIIKLTNVKLIDESLSKTVLHKSLVVENQILLTIAGTIGNASVAYQMPRYTNSNQAIANITLKAGISSFYVSTFLNSKLGRNQTQRLIISNVQPNLLLTQVKLIKVVLPSDEFQTLTEKIIKFAYSKIEKSKQNYLQAEDLLLSELGLKEWQPTEETVAVKSFAESFLSSGRLDAEYYQPKYDQVEEVIKNCGFPSQNLGSLIEPIQNGFDYREYTEEGTPYIRVGDVKNGQINFESAVKIPITMADVDKPVGLQVGDILFTRKGSFGNSAVVTELEVNGIISSEIMLVRLTSASRQEILPEYVSLFLNSKFGYLQVERRVHGVAYYSISQPDLANLLIPILPKSQQQKIVEKINSSFSLKLKSKQLLEIAKTGVERAIETNEATATTWINQQLEALGINLSNLN